MNSISVQARKPHRKLTEEEKAKERRKQKTRPYFMVAPAMFFLVVFTFFPIVYLIVLSFFKYNLISKMQFLGVDNYVRLFTVETTFGVALRNTAIYTISLIVLLIFLSMLLAIWLEHSSLLNAIAQRLMFLPHLCATLTVAVVFQWLMNDEGMLNAMLRFFHLPALRWLNSSDTALMSIILISTWKSLGYYTLIMLSSLKSIPTELYEAAALDNTGPIRKFFKITLPMVSPQLFFLLITITIGSFKVFDTVRIITEGGPGDSTNTVVLWIYNKAFSGTIQVGLASAAGVVLMLIMAILTGFYFKALNNKIYYQ
jgi:sn-glycerol 3-phosphate transport system permease protein